MFFFNVFLIINLLYAGKTPLMPELADRAGPNAGRNLLPVLLAVALLQALVLRAVSEAILPVLAGLVRVAAGIGLFLRGLDLSVIRSAGTWPSLSRNGVPCHSCWLSASAWDSPR